MIVYIVRGVVNGNPSICDVLKVVTSKSSAEEYIEHRKTLDASSDLSVYERFFIDERPLEI